MKNSKLVIGFIFLVVYTSCRQQVSVKSGKLTGINPVSYTDVVYKAELDTVLASTFDGKIYEIINGRSGRNQIAAIEDEVYSMVYDFGQDRIIVATLNSGILVLDGETGETLRKIGLKEAWSYDLYYNEQVGILCSYDVKGNSYVWNTKDNFNTLMIPTELKGVLPRFISEDGAVYFDGVSSIYVWKYLMNEVTEIEGVKGKLIDVDHEGNCLLFSNKQFAFYSKETDDFRFQKRHPDWPMYIADRDTTIYIPLSLHLISGVLTEKHIYTCGLDKSIRKWDKLSGELIETFLQHPGTISAVALSEDESQLVSVDLMGEVKFWDL